MTDRSFFNDDEWHALTEAPMLITAAVFAVGEHGPISMIKEATASARSIAQPGERGSANELIGAIVAEATTKEARAEIKEHRAPTPQATVDLVLQDLAPAAAAVKKLPADEANQVAAWYLAIGEAVAASAKQINPGERAALDRIAQLFGISAA